MFGRILLLASLCTLALAFSDTLPLIAWSSHRSDHIDRLTSAQAAPYAELLEHIIYGGQTCSFEAIFLVEQPGLHASDLRALPETSKLFTSLVAAPSSVQFPYVGRPSPTSFSRIASSLSSRCNSTLINLSPGTNDGTFNGDSRHVITMSLPHLRGTGAARKDSAFKHNSCLSNALEAMVSTFPRHLVVISGSPSSLLKRQSSDLVPPSDGNAFIFADGNFTLPEGGILKRYQLLTPGLITTLLLTVFVILPIISAGVSALASIQSPVRLDAPKGYSAQEKKTQ